MVAVSEEAARGNGIFRDGEIFAGPEDSQSRYVYGVAAGSEVIELGCIGIEHNRVYSIPGKGMCAIVHNCPSKPYQSRDSEVVKEWVKAHQRVVEAARERLGTVVPLRFDTIIRPGGSADNADPTVRRWLEEDHNRLTALIDRIRGRDEYGVEIFYEPGALDAQIAEQSETVKQIQKEITEKSPGTAYLYRQKLENTVRLERGKLADQLLGEFRARIKRHSDDTVFERATRSGKGKVMLASFSCLVAGDRVASLGEELEKINRMEGFSVRFSGPWPPYSFVARKLVGGEGK